LKSNSADQLRSRAPGAVRRTASCGLPRRRAGALLGVYVAIALVPNLRHGAEERPYAGSELL